MTLMWMYAGYTWLTSTAPRSPPPTPLLLIAMAGFFIMALTVPDAFGAGGLPYALGLLYVTAIHTYLFSTAPTVSAQAIGDRGLQFRRRPAGSRGGLRAAAVGLAPLDGGVRSVLLLVSFRRRVRDFRLSPAHFVERNGLLMIVALGESVVAVGLSARELPLDLPLIPDSGARPPPLRRGVVDLFDRDIRHAEHV